MIVLINILVSKLGSPNKNFWLRTYKVWYWWIFWAECFKGRSYTCSPSYAVNSIGKINIVWCPHLWTWISSKLIVNLFKKKKRWIVNRLRKMISFTPCNHFHSSLKFENNPKLDLHIRYQPCVDFVAKRLGSFGPIQVLAMEVITFFFFNKL